MNCTLQEYKDKIYKEYNCTEFHDSHTSLKAAFNTGTILLIPDFSTKQRQWIMKAYEQWNRFGRTVILVTQLKTFCAYSKDYLFKHAEIKIIYETIFINGKKVTKPMILAIYKEIPLKLPNLSVVMN
jgi:hypothetical protein